MSPISNYLGKIRLTEWPLYMSCISKCLEEVVISPFNLISSSVQIWFQIEKGNNFNQSNHHEKKNKALCFISECSKQKKSIPADEKVDNIFVSKNS